MSSKSTKNSMKKAAKLGKTLAIIFLTIAFVSVCIYFYGIDTGARKKGEKTKPGAKYAIQTEVEESENNFEEMIVATTFSRTSATSRASKASRFSGVLATSTISSDVNEDVSTESSEDEESLEDTSTEDSENGEISDDTNILDDEDLDREKNSNVPYVAAKASKKIQENIIENGKADLDKVVDEMVKTLEEVGKTNVLDVHLGRDKDKQKEFLKTFIKASYSTMFPKLGDSDDLDGIIVIKRGNKKLDYKPYEEFMELINENDSDAEDYFTLTFEDESARLVLATWYTDSDNNKTYLTTEPFTYQKNLNLFSMPFDFLWAVLIVGRDKDFVMELAELAIDDSKEIVISVFDTVLIEQETDAEGNIKETKENVVNLAVTRADTWLLQYEAGVTIKVDGEVVLTTDIGSSGDDGRVTTENALTEEEIEAYMSKLPEGLSQERRDLIETALLAVGVIPYYMGGTASKPGFEGNNFGATIEPDPYNEKRTKKGLDCAKFVCWATWTALGDNLGHSYTGDLITSHSYAISKKDLLPGDIAFKNLGTARRHNKSCRNLFRR